MVLSRAMLVACEVAGGWCARGGGGGSSRGWGGGLTLVALAPPALPVEYLMGLQWSPQAQWLRETDQGGPLQVCARVAWGGGAGCGVRAQAHALLLLPPCAAQAEIAAESARVQAFIVDREIEAPERFQAIQSYR